MASLVTSVIPTVFQAQQRDAQTLPAAIKINDLSKEELIEVLREKGLFLGLLYSQLDLGIGPRRPGQSIAEQLLTLSSSSEILKTLDNYVTKNASRSDTAKDDIARALAKLKDEIKNPDLLEVISFLKGNAQYSDIKHPRAEALKLMSVYEDPKRIIEILNQLNEFDTSNKPGSRDVGVIKYRETLDKLGIDIKVQLTEQSFLFRSLTDNLNYNQSPREQFIQQRSEINYANVLELSGDLKTAGILSVAKKLVSASMSEDSTEFNKTKFTSILDTIKTLLGSSALYGFRIKSDYDLNGIISSIELYPDQINQLNLKLKEQASLELWQGLVTKYPSAVPYQDIQDFTESTGFLTILDNLPKFNLALVGEELSKPLSLEPLDKLYKYFKGQGLPLHIDIAGALPTFPFLKVLDDPDFEVFLKRYSDDKMKKEPDGPRRIESFGELSEVAELFAKQIVARDINNLKTSRARFLSEADRNLYLQEFLIAQKFKELGFTESEIPFSSVLSSNLLEGYRLDQSEILTGLNTLTANQSFVPALKDRLFAARSNGGWGFTAVNPEAFLKILSDPKMREFYSGPQSSANAARYHSISDVLRTEASGGSTPELSEPEALQSLLSNQLVTPGAPDSELRRIALLVPEICSAEGIEQYNLKRLIELITEAGPRTPEQNLKSLLDIQVKLIEDYKHPRTNLSELSYLKYNRSLQSLFDELDNRITKDLFRRFSEGDKESFAQLPFFLNANKQTLKEFVSAADQAMNDLAQLKIERTAGDFFALGKVTEAHVQRITTGAFQNFLSNDYKKRIAANPNNRLVGYSVSELLYLLDLQSGDR